MASGRRDDLIEEMFVQVAERLEADDESVSLIGLASSTLYFSDRPEVVVGHMTTDQFLEQWTVGEDSFAVDPPNALLSFCNSGIDAPGEVHVVLSSPVVDGDALMYGVEVLEGVLPDKAGPCTLFIDPLRRPFTPTSAAAMQRRGRRRLRRRL